VLIGKFMGPDDGLEIIGHPVSDGPEFCIPDHLYMSFGSFSGRFSGENGLA